MAAGHASQVQLSSYFSGYTAIYDLREELKKELGGKFDFAQKCPPADWLAP